MINDNLLNTTDTIFFKMFSERKTDMNRNLRMKEARKEKALSQEELARLADVSRQTINMIERGDFNPSLQLCIRICRILGKTLDELFWEE